MADVYWGFLGTWESPTFLSQTPDGDTRLTKTLALKVVLDLQ